MLQTAEWSTSPVGASASLLDDILGPRRSPQFCMDFEPSRPSASDPSFPSFPFSYWREKASSSKHWNDGFDRPTTKDSFIFDSSEISFRNQTTGGIRERSCDPHYDDNNSQPFLPHQTRLPDRHSADQMHFSQDQNPFNTKRNYFAFESRHPNQSNKPFQQFTHPSTHPLLRAHHNDVMDYPPSHMLERGPALPLSSLPSPVQWSFPPMKLY